MYFIFIYSKDYGLDHLPMIFIQTATTAVSIVLLKLYVKGFSSDLNNTEKQLEQISQIIDNVAKTWTAVVPIQEAINQSRQVIAHRKALQEPACFDWENIMTTDCSEVGIPGDLATLNEDILSSEYELPFQETI
ncbi:hypothetical protein N7462_002810 [Penicillium macrosclerotiorum]|uniref:uncharacterized protein n=1 Tax=Penicillium macrosclerotiorum TaxID=303699 RepID=UPI002548237E|nr:uncharacterized protein N7462_002810 [Penicillium macrosclerotiorum]KAJ5693387.1 hypothetical protein N7462_002810 [Penicillium macrosclerotiorum]